MARAFATLVTLAWALWLGGMVFLFVALASVFTTPGFDREAAGTFAAGLFPKFERMQLILAAVALGGTFGWWVCARGRAKLVLFALFAGATLAAVAETTLITPRVEALRVARQRGTPQFERMHRLSSRVYSAGAAVLLVAGLVLPAAVRSDAGSGGGRKVRRDDAQEPANGNGLPEHAAAPLAPSHSAARD